MLMQKRDSETSGDFKASSLSAWLIKCEELSKENVY
jgi:hypothetical protein